KQGRTVDFLLSKWRDVAAAKRFFSRAVKQHGAPRVITLDGYAASHRAVDKLKATGRLPRRVRVRSSERVFEKLTLPLRSRAHLRDYGSHEHPMLRHRSQRRRLGLDRPVPAGSLVGWAATHDRPARRPLTRSFTCCEPVASGACYPALFPRRAPLTVT